MIEPTLNQAMIEVPIQRLAGNDDVPLPSYQSDHAAGMDLHAAVPADEVIEPGEVKLVPCGFAMAVPVGYEAQVRPRSGLAAGTIDADYRGEVKVPMINHGKEAFTVTRGMRVAQMLIKPVPRTRWREVDALPETARGDGGFGHTGH